MYKYTYEENKFFFETSGTTNTATQRHNSKDRNPQLHRCENLQTRKPMQFKATK
jgi:hypothetical protein